MCATRKTTMTPYEVLGVARDADAGEIKRAYRRRAKSEHPDHGGSKERFGSLTRAYNILKDPGRRQRYDQTGDETEATADNSRAEILATLSMHMDRIVQSALRYNQSPQEFDQVETLVRSLNEGIVEIKTGQAGAEKSIEVWEKLLGRFRKKTGGQSVLDTLIQGKISIQKQGVAEGGRKIAVLEAAIEIAKSETFRQDKKPPPSFSMGRVGPMQAFQDAYLGRMFGRGG